MSAHVLSKQFYEVNSGALEVIKDPGASGTLRTSNKGFARFEIVTAGAEGRTLEDAVKLPNYTVYVVTLKTDGGDLTITAGSNSVVLSSVGDTATFQVVPAGTSKEWRIVSVDDGPIALGTVSVSITDADTQAAFLALIQGLKARGIVTGTFT